MKQKIVFILLISFCGLTYAQTLPDGFKQAKEVYYYGLEFSEVRAFGDGFENAPDVINRYFPDMNTYYYEGKDHNGLSMIFNGKKLLFDAGEAINHILSIDPKTLVSMSARDYRHLNQSAITEIVSRYKKTDQPSYGFVVIMEDLNKLEGYGSMWPTVFDTATGEVIYTSRYEGAPSGFGLKRYWLGSVDDALFKFGKDMRKLLKAKKK